MYQVPSGNGYVVDSFLGTAILRLTGSDAILTGCQPADNLSNQPMRTLKPQQTPCCLKSRNIQEKAALLESQTQISMFDGV